MAFPTSSLTNNLVHKEGNRAFVYDSTLGVWDQVRETDRTENKIFSGEISGAVTGTLGSGVTFPAGHIIQTKYAIATQQDVSTTSSNAWNAYHTGLAIPITRTAGTKFSIMIMGGRTDNVANSRIFYVDITRSDGLFFSGFTHAQRVNSIRFGDSTNGSATIGSGDAANEGTYNLSYGIVDTNSVSGDYTYQPVFTGSDGGNNEFQATDSGTMIAIGIEFIG